MSLSELTAALLARIRETAPLAQLNSTDLGWELAAGPGERPIRWDYNRDFAQFQKGVLAQGLSSQPLARAVGAKKGERPHVFDVTGGTGGDSLLLLTFGCQVTTQERHPLALFLLWDAYQRFEHATKIQWNLLLTPLDDMSGHTASVLYFDPMYGEGANQKTAPRKEMRIFRELVGEDHDAEQVAVRLAKMGKRLVIKRPMKAPPLLAAPSFQSEGKSTRYDVYLPVK